MKFIHISVTIILIYLWLIPPIFAVTSQNHAAASRSGFASSSSFPEPALVQEQVKFWNAIFSRFPSTTTLIHDSMHPTIVVDLIDHQVFAKKLGNSLTSSRRQRDKLSNDYLRRYQLGVERFAKFQSNATTMGAIEQRLYNVYRRNPEALKDLYTGNIILRLQTGLSDEFRVAAQRAAPLLPDMEEIFFEQGLPVALTRLAFVESMFNQAALSKVGASGIWQFMPDTARRFMRVDRWIDERANPLKATRSAAQLLRQNYNILGSWPLAITAYNHGSASLQRAIRELGTNDFTTIQNMYRSASFGYASRNFYAEFLSANRTYESNHRNLTVARMPNTKLVRLKKPVSIKYLVINTPLTRDILSKYNRCLSKRALEKYENEPLPRNFELAVPKNLENAVTMALSEPKFAKKSRS